MYIYVGINHISNNNNNNNNSSSSSSGGNYTVRSYGFSYNHLNIYIDRQ